ncbi:MAG: VWA domain-containing protein [Holophagales bacterium]|nr:VWA domain-containing protein [Holophagales bacterium]
MRRDIPRFCPHLPLVLLPLALALPALTVPVSAQEDTTCRFPADLAAHLLGGGFDSGDLPVGASFVVDEALLLDEGRLQATVEGQVQAGPLSLRPSASLCVFLLLDVDGEAILAHQMRLELDDFATVESLRYVLRADLPEGTRRMTFVAREAESGLWGAAPMQDPGEPIRGPSFTARRIAEYEGAYYELTHRAEGAPPPDAPQTTLADRLRSRPGQAGAASGSTAGSNTGSGTPAPDPADVMAPVPKRVRVPGTGRGPFGQRRPTEKLAGEQILRLVPPRDQPVSGSTVFNVLTSTVAVEKVAFELDGRRVDEDGRPPFRARLDLASPPREQEVKAIAYDGLGVPMGEDTIRVNQVDQPFRVRITDFSGDPASGPVILEAETSIPPDATLEKLEIFYNEELLGTYRNLRVRREVRLDTVQPTDYLRVAATLTDGTSIDDVLLLAAPEVEEVDVNLVELHVVVTDRNGTPVENLAAGDFEIVLDGKTQSASTFAYADDVPLVLGLLVDTSGSMELLMHDTRRAAARFLGQTVLPQDKAYLVDFDLQPRLLHGVTGDLPSLLRSLARLDAAGRTAMYDAVVFSLLQFESHVGRRALVVLTDGDDIDSRYGPKHSAEMARQAGVPVYVIGLGALDTLRRTFSKNDLERITEGTGGRLYFVNTFEELARAYAEINAELRSQYSLGFYTERDLTDEERRKVKVEVPRGMDARTVVGARITGQ